MGGTCERLEWHGFLVDGSGYRTGGARPRCSVFSCRRLLAALPPQPSEPGAFAETPRLLRTRARPADGEWAGGPTCTTASGANLVRLSQVGTRTEVHLCLWRAWPTWGRGGGAACPGRAAADRPPTKGPARRRAPGVCLTQHRLLARTSVAAVTRSPGERWGSSAAHGTRSDTIWMSTQGKVGRPSCMVREGPLTAGFHE